MHGDLEALYDAHAHRLYAHCWSLLGDQGAADALRDTFTESLRHTPQGEVVLSMHRLARAACSDRGAFNLHGHALFAQAATDPLLSAASGLSAAHREALLLYSGEWLDVRDIARVIRISPDAVRGRLHEARTALERLVLDALMRGAADPTEHMDVIAAFEKGRLPHLLARRAPGLAPAPLRDHVLGEDAAHHEYAAQSSFGDGYDVIGDAPVEPTGPGRPLVVIGSGSAAAGPAADPGRGRGRRRAFKTAGGVAGIAATVAVGLLMTWPSADKGTVNALGPPDGNMRPGPTGGIDGGTDLPGSTPPKTAAPDPTPTTQKRAPSAAPPQRPSSNATGLERKAPVRETPSTPTPAPERTAPPPTSAPPTTPPPTEQPPPDDGGNGDGGGPLKPVTDIVDHLASPIFGGLAGE